MSTTTAEQFYDDGNSCLAIGELADAEQNFRKATLADARYYDAWHALAMVLYKQNKYPEAIQAGLKAVEIEPNDSMGWTTLSIAYMKNGQIPEAEAASAKVKVISWGGKVDQMNLEGT